jgi:hypothetical protein
MARVLALNLGGEGEVPGVINQQRPRVLGPNWFRTLDRKTLAEVVAEGHDFLICPNEARPFPDGIVDIVYTNSVPIDTPDLGFGPGVQSSEIRRILKPGGVWVRDGVTYYTKP